MPMPGVVRPLVRPGPPVSDGTVDRAEGAGLAALLLVAGKLPQGREQGPAPSCPQARMAATTRPTAVAKVNQKSTPSSAALGSPSRANAPAPTAVARAAAIVAMASRPSRVTMVQVKATKSRQ
jgi:hypothetical protein